jgi:CheY-like chemotaxis protein
MPMPRVYLLEQPAPNAFATGRDPQHAVVAVTTGILEVASSRELRAVLTHELGHVRNRDTLVMAVVASIAGAISFIAQMAQWSMCFGGRDDDEDSGKRSCNGSTPHDGPDRRRVPFRAEVLDQWSTPSDPPDSGKPPDPSAARSSTASDRGGSPILVVEDDPSILDMVLQILRAEGYPVVGAKNGVEGLVQVDHRAPSLILLDMRMPRMDGWEFAAALRARGVASPVVVMTAADNARRWAEEVGADGYVMKPFEFLELLASVEKHRRLPPRH